MIALKIFVICWLCMSIALAILGASTSVVLLGPVALVLDFFETYRSYRNQRNRKK